MATTQKHDVKDLALDKPLYKKLRRVIPPGVTVIEVGQYGPHLVLGLTFSDPKGRHLVPGFHYPGCGHSIQKLIDVILI